MLRVALHRRRIATPPDTNDIIRAVNGEFWPVARRWLLCAGVSCLLFQGRPPFDALLQSRRGFRHRLTGPGVIRQCFPPAISTGPECMNTPQTPILRNYCM